MPVKSLVNIEGIGRLEDVVALAKLTELEGQAAALRDQLREHSRAAAECERQIIEIEEKHAEPIRRALIFRLGGGK